MNSATLCLVRLAIFCLLTANMANAQYLILQLDASSSVEFLVIDPLGRTTGKDPNSGQIFNGIPDGNYGYEGYANEENPNEPISYFCQFTTGADSPPINGTYRIRVAGIKQGGFDIGYNIQRENSHSRSYLNGVAAPGRVIYYNLTFDSNPTVPLALSRVPPTGQVSGGIFNPSGSTLSVKAKPSVNFASGNSLKTVVVTVRWFTSYGITLSAPTSSYGFQKWDSVIVLGGYSYQKFRTTVSTPINWTAGTEYELFTFTVSGGQGMGFFDLTNQIPGGEWFVDINYSDKSDTTFYAGSTSSPLPIELVSFTCFVTSQLMVQLNWTTLTEVHNYGFEVQRSRDSLTGFQTLPNSFCPGHGTTIVPHSYTWTDSIPGGRSWYYRLKQIDLDGTLHYTYSIKATVPKSTNAVSGGVFIAGLGTCSVRAKPNVTFGSGDTLRALIACLRWPTSTPVSLGTISSPTYGVTKVDSVITLGNFRYQKFRTMQKKGLNWQSQVEQELFTVPIANPTGLENIELTNALAGGEWFVDINYLDKTDTSLYQPLAQGYIYSNKSENWAATYDNSARHILLTSTKFHEAYTSAGEIIYRRKNISTGWEVTKRISAGDGSNGNSCILLDHANIVHVVWQHQHGTSLVFDLCYNRSLDGGTSWGTPSVLVSSIGVSSNQWEIYPVLAEYATSQLVIVYTTSAGLKYVRSTNGGTSWNSPTSISTSYPNTTWFLSLAKGNNFLTLTYDTRYYGVYSIKYNGSTWGTAQNISSAVGTIYDRNSSVAIEGNNLPMATWCAQRSGRNEYRIVYRLGVAGGDSWSSTYVEFTQRPSGISDFYPSIHSFLAPGGINIREILWQTTDNQVPMLQWVYGNWYTSTLSTSGLWANTALGSSGRAWTDQSSNPYQITLSSYDGSLHLQSLTSPGSSVQIQRRLTLESEASGSFVSFELTPLKVVTSNGDTTVLPFKPIDWEKPLVLTEAEAWEYLGTDDVTLPSNTKYLVFDAEIQTVTREDSSGQKASINVFSEKTFNLSIVKGAQKSPVLTAKTAESGPKVLDISSFAGQTVAVRPGGSAPTKAGGVISVAVGDIYAPKR